MYLISNEIILRLHVIQAGIGTRASAKHQIARLRKVTICALVRNDKRHCSEVTTRWRK